MVVKTLIELIQLIVDLLKKMVRDKRVKDLKDAKDTALNERDQRSIEDALGGSSGPVSDDKYPGLHTRPSKKKD